MSDLPMREMSLAEILSELPVGHRARKEWNETLHRLSVEKNERLNLEQVIASKLKTLKPVKVDDVKFNNIYKDCEAYALNNTISRDETHIDFDVLNENFVTWYLSDEPELSTTPSCYVRSISDVKKINKLKSQLTAANERIAELEKTQEPDMFWLADDGEMSFDSLHELADYHLDSYECERNSITVKIQQATSSPSVEYEFNYDSDVNEWNYKPLPPQPKDK